MREVRSEEVRSERGGVREARSERSEGRSIHKLEDV